VLTTSQVLAPLARLRTGEVVVTTMSMVRPWGRLSSHALDFASADSAMGHAADFALGIAIAQPDRRVLCLNGDGSMLMTLGTLVSAAAATNLVLFIIDNGTYEITGNQAVPGGGIVDYAAMARAAGFPEAFSYDGPEEYEAALPAILAIDGPVLVSLRVEPGSEGPISRTPSEEARYLRVSLERSAHQLRRDLTED